MSHENHGTIHWKFKNKNNTTISDYFLTDLSLSGKDYYIPVGIDQILASANIALQSGAPVDTVIDDVVWYEIEVGTFPHLLYNLF